MQVHNSTYQERLSTTISLCVLYTTSIISCGLVLLVTWKGELYKTRVNLLLANVALADFLLNLSNLISQPPNIMSDTKWFACDWVGWITYMTGLGANWFIPMVAINRYISIFHREMFKRIYTTRNIILMIILGWVVIAVITSPFQIWKRTGYEWQYENCGVNNEDSTLWLILVYLIVVIPTFTSNGITTYCNTRIFMKLRDHAKKTTTMVKNNVMAQNKQLMYVTVLHTLLAIFLQSPYVLGKLFPVLVTDNPARQIFPCMYIFNGTISPLTTLYVVKPYRRALMNTVCCRANVVQPQIMSLAAVTSTVTRRGRNRENGETSGSTRV